MMGLESWLEHFILTNETRFCEESYDMWLRDLSIVRRGGGGKEMGGLEANDELIIFSCSCSGGFPMAKSLVYMRRN